MRQTAAVKPRNQWLSWPRPPRNLPESTFLLALACLTGASCEVHLGDPNPQQPVGPQPAAVAQSAPPPAANPGQATPAIGPPGPRRVIALHLHGDAATGNASGGAAPPAGSSCLDIGAAPVGDCNAMQAPDASCAPSEAAKQKCNAYKAYFTSKVAAAAVACMTALSNRQVCDAAEADNCARSALAQACPDSSVAQLCSIAAAPCKTNTTDCAAMISGLNDQAKQGVAQCIAQGCAAGLYACIQGLPF